MQWVLKRRTISRSNVTLVVITSWPEAVIVIINGRSRAERKLLAPVDLRAGIVGTVVSAFNGHGQGLAVRRDFHGARFRRHTANLAGSFDGVGVVAFDRDGIE